MRTGIRVKNKIKDNRGISLVELIVVIAMMVVLTGVAGWSISFMFTRDANYVAVRIDDELSEARMLSMSKDGAFTYKLNIVPASKGSTVQIMRSVGGAAATVYSEVVLDKSVNIEVTGAGIDTTDDTIEIVFNKSNGSVNTVNGAAATGIYEIKVTSTRNASKIKTVTLVSTTGRHYTDAK